MVKSTNCEAPHGEKFEIAHILSMSEIQKLKLSMGISVSLYSYKRTVKLRSVCFFCLMSLFQPSRLHDIECNCSNRL